MRPTVLLLLKMLIVNYVVAWQKLGFLQIKTV